MSVNTIKEGLHAEILNAIARLSDVRGKAHSIDEFFSNPENTELCAYHLSSLCESLISLIKYIIVKMNHAVSELQPNNMLDILKDKKILTHEDYEILSELISMRDALVCPFLAQLDYEKVFNLLHEHFEELINISEKLRRYGG